MNLVNMNNVILKEEDIEELKSDTKKLYSFVKTENNGRLFFVLNKLGKLPNDFDDAPLLYLVDHKDAKIRYLAIKNLAKLGKFSLFPVFKKVIANDPSADVRREATSAIGRLRNLKAIPFLIELLKDSDPEVVMQAIRGLLVFKSNQLVVEELRKLKEHPNEIIQDIIKKEFFPTTSGKKIFKHTEFPDFLRNKVVLGDVQEIIKYVSDESVHLTFTSPPYYNAREYSIYQSYEQYLKFLEDVFKEVYRITKEGRFFILNTSPIIIPRVSRQHASRRYPIPYDIHPLLVKMGWEFIDDIVWVKPEASVKNRNAGFLQHRKPLAYKPNARTEMVMVYRKKTDKLIDWNIKQYDRRTVEESKVTGNYETSNVWEIDPVFDKTHSAVFPLELCRRVIKFYSFKGDLVFDPFAGSGTLGKAAQILGRYFFLTEIDSKYFERIKENLGFVGVNYSIFNNSKKL
jgi:DNA modification methylase